MTVRTDCVLSTGSPLPSPIKALAHWLLVEGSWPLARSPPFPQVVLCVKSLQSCPTLCDLVDCSPPGFYVHGILQSRTLGGLPFPSQGIFPTQGSNLCLMSPAFSSRFFKNNTTWKSPRLPASKRKQTFLSTNLASLLALAWQAAGPPLSVATPRWFSVYAHILINYSQ